MKYSKYSLNQRSNKKIVTHWAFKEGVFKTPQGKYIARILDHRGYVTLSSHETEEEAKKVYDNFYISKGQLMKAEI